MHRSEESGFFRRSSRTETWWEEPAWARRTLGPVDKAALALIRGWKRGECELLQLGEACWVAMHECDTRAKEWTELRLTTELRNAGDEGIRIAVRLARNRPSTWKKYLSVMHRLCWYLRHEGVKQLKDVSKKIVIDQLNAAINVNCTESVIVGLKYGWERLLEWVDPSIMRDKYVKDLIEAHRTEAAKKPKRAEPMRVEYLRKIHRTIYPRLSPNDQCVFALHVYLFLGVNRFEHLHSAMWRDLRVARTAAGVRALVLNHEDGQKQSGKDERLQTVTVEGDPSLLGLLNSVAAHQPSEWPYIFGIRGKDGRMQMIDLSRVNHRIKKWMGMSGHLRPNDFSSHSGRRGAVTESYRLGLSESHIQHAGKWKGNSYEKYNESRHYDGVIISAALLGESSKLSGASALKVKSELEKDDMLRDWVETSASDAGTSTKYSVAERSSVARPSEPTVVMGEEATKLKDLFDWVNRTNARRRSLGLPVTDF